MKAPTINVFAKPYEVWETRTPNTQEALDYFCKYDRFVTSINVRLIEKINNHFEAAKHMAINGADNALENFIDDFLDKSLEYKLFRKMMPPITPSGLYHYQQKYTQSSKIKANIEINKINCTLGDNQYLFHGGLWPDFLSETFITNAPLSTTFCPQVALRNAEWCEKAYSAGQIDLFVIKARNSRTNAFCYRRRGTKMGNEKEVIVASGAKLTLNKRTLIRADYPVAAYGKPDKMIPIYVIEVDLI